MADCWQNWCRLCAKMDGNDIDIFLKLESITELSVLVQKYLLISITPFDDTPTAICSDCFKFISHLDAFAGRCTKVDKMFTELIYDKMNNVVNEITTVRYKYGLDEEEKALNCYMKINQSTDTMDLETDEHNFNTFTVKEEDLETVALATRKKRGRPKKNDLFTKLDKYEKIESVVIKKEEEPLNGDDLELTSENDDDDDVPDEMAYDENDEENKELQRELADLQDTMASSSEDEKPISKRRRKRKMKKDEIEIISCPVPECGITVNRRRAYEHHMRTKHTDPETTYNCSVCPKSFPTDKKRRIHETTHLPKSLKMVHPCPYCEKKFTKPVNVQAHIRAIHIADRPFICEECGKSFVAKGALKEHQIIHSDERPYQCSHCPKKFKNLARLKVHEDIHNETTYVCPHCGLQLNTKRTLKMHMVVHSDQKKYKCQYCGNEYKRSKALKNHLILHTGLRPYICPFCDKTFANGSNCRSHKKKSHPLELAALEASGEAQRIPNIPKLENLQPKQLKIQQQIQGILDQKSPTVKTEDLSERPNSVNSTIANTSHLLPSLTQQHNGLQITGLLAGESIMMEVSSNLQQQAPSSAQQATISLNI